MRRSLRCSIVSKFAVATDVKALRAAGHDVHPAGAAGRSARRRNQIIRLLADGADPASLPDLLGVRHVTVASDLAALRLAGRLPTHERVDGPAGDP